MTTFREIEAFVAVIEMGSFSEAARKLKTSQSAVSRLIRDFESGFDKPLFYKGRRSSQVTSTGTEVLNIARTILEKRNDIFRRFSTVQVNVYRLRLGVTELAAMTWLPECVSRLKSHYPGLVLEVESGDSASLYSKIRTGLLDLVVISDVIHSQDMLRIATGQEDLGWYCHPDYAISATPDLAELSGKTLLLQAESTTTGSLVAAWLSENASGVKDIIQSNSLASLLGMATRGTGIVCAPKCLADTLVTKGLLREVAFPAEPMKIRYMTLIKVEQLSDFLREVAAIVGEVNRVTPCGVNAWPQETRPC